jgi:hypothetical protein
VNARGNGQRGHNARASSLAIPNGRRNGGPASANPNGPALSLDNITIPGPGPVSPTGRDGSPTLPTLPSHPTLDSLINSTLASDGGNGGGVALPPRHQPPPQDPAIVIASPTNGTGGAGPRIGDPGKRMLGAALGMRHPSLGPRPGEQGMSRPMGGLTVME